MATDIAIVQQGRLVTHATPESLLRSVEGRVWEWTVPSAHLPLLKQQYVISSTMRKTDGIRVRIISTDAPHPDAAAVSQTLEDAYLAWIRCSDPVKPR